MNRDELEAVEPVEEVNELREQVGPDEADVTPAAPCIRTLLEEVHREEASQQEQEEG
jgi:hypothetical protein